MSNRLHFVSIDVHPSDLLPVKSGVPQGSVLGPLLFLIYANDLPCTTSFSSTFLFADDSKLFLPISHDYSASHLQRDLDALTTWCSTWKLIFNCSKCVSLHLALSSPSSVIYNSDNHALDCVTKHKDLGVYMCNNLSWSEHVKFITSKAYRALHLIRRTFSTPSTSLSLQIYLSLVRSQLCYTAHLYGDLGCLRMLSV